MEFCGILSYQMAEELLPVNVPPTPIFRVLASVPAKVKVLLNVKVFPAVPVSVYVPVVSVLPLNVVATKAPIVCVPVNVLAASVRASVALVVGNVIVVASVPANVMLLLNVTVLPSTPANVRLLLNVAVLLLRMVRVAAVAGVVNVYLLTVEVRMVAPLMAGFVSVLFVSVSVVAKPTSVSVASGSVRTALPSAPVGGDNVIEPLVAFRKSNVPAAVPVVPIESALMIRRGLAIVVGFNPTSKSSK